jgi:SAM-dependent methyltransferase
MRTLAIKVWSAIAPFFEWLFEIESWIARKWVAGAHRRLMFTQWKRDPQPEHFDHHIDLFWQWQATRTPLLAERGVFDALAMEPGCQVLELACGDGFAARNFYSIKASKVVACDFDPAAIRTAMRKNKAPNVEFVLADIRNAMPLGAYDNVVWSAAIEHFTPEEIEAIMRTIKSRLKPGGILSGYTIVERPDGKKSLHQHEYEFQSKEDLARFLTPHFRHVKVFETLYPSRHNLYFWASDGAIPFAAGWARAT